MFLCGMAAVKLSFSDLLMEDVLFQEGTWNLQFDLAPMPKEMPLTVDSAEVAYFYHAIKDENHPTLVMDDGRKMYTGDDCINEERFTTIRNIQVSTEGVRFVVDNDEIEPEVAEVILADGTKIGTSLSAHLSYIAGEPTWVYYWEFPVDLTQATALRFTASGSPVPVRDTIVPLK